MTLSHMFDTCAVHPCRFHIERPSVLQPFCFNPPKLNTLHLCAVYRATNVSPLPLCLHIASITVHTRLFFSADEMQVCLCLVHFLCVCVTAEYRLMSCGCTDTTLTHSDSHCNHILIRLFNDCINSGPGLSGCVVESTGMHNQALSVLTYWNCIRQSQRNNHGQVLCRRRGVRGQCGGAL